MYHHFDTSYELDIDFIVFVVFSKQGLICHVCKIKGSSTIEFWDSSFKVQNLFHKAFFTTQRKNKQDKRHLHMQVQTKTTAI